MRIINAVRRFLRPRKGPSRDRKRVRMPADLPAEGSRPRPLADDRKPREMQAQTQVQRAGKVPAEGGCSAAEDERLLQDLRRWQAEMWDLDSRAL